MLKDIFSRHKNIALSLSGGKDSLACLYLYKAYWDRLTVYWCNTGDAFPETIEMMERIKKMVPRFKEVKGSVKEIQSLDGWPSDVVPAMHTTDGNAIFGKTDFKVQPRVSCCFRSLMLPTYAAMIKDGVTCVIRGKRHDEADKTGLMSGHVSEDGIELIFPIYEWTSEDVYSYLKSIDVELPKFYKHGNHSIDCQHCTAFWEDGHANYLRNEHPVLFFEYKRRIGLIKSAIADQMKLCEV